MMFRLLLVSMLCSPALVASVPAAERPNVLLIAVDDLNDWVHCLSGHPDTKTPNIDRLAERGVLFTNAHCQGPICNPSRTSIMFGLRPSTTGIYMNKPTPWTVPAMRDRVTMARHFAAGGYQTYTTGKIYHASGLPEGDFDVIGPRHRQRIDLDVRRQKDLKGLWDFGPQSYPEEKFIDHIDATWVIDRLKEPHEKPFMMAVGFYRPHVPFYSPDRIFHSVDPQSLRLPKVKSDDLEDLPQAGLEIAKGGSPNLDWFIERNLWREGVQSYLACIRWTDEQIGRVLDALDASQFADNTIIVMYSDHGFHLGEKERWRKATLWERSTHVPLVMVAPGMSRGKPCGRPVELLSIYPTLIELCGLPQRDDLDGVSIIPLLKRPDAEWERPAMTTLGPNNHAVRTERWRYIRYADGGEELYDHTQDPHEWHNLANDRELEAVKRRLLEWLPKKNAPEARTKATGKNTPKKNAKRKRKG
jgi:arylsulfatase A-like enzyme